MSDFFCPNTGGIETHIYYLGECLLRRGHKVIVLTHGYGKRIGIRYFTNGLKVSLSSIFIYEIHSSRFIIFHSSSYTSRIHCHQSPDQCTGSGRSSFKKTSRSSMAIPLSPPWPTRLCSMPGVWGSIQSLQIIRSLGLPTLLRF